MTVAVRLEAINENPHLSGNYAPVTCEITAFNLPITGTVPEDLDGRLLRIGPNPIDADPARYHWFMGSGMAHGLRLRGGKAEWYRNRWITSEDTGPKLGRKPLPGPHNGPSVNNVNTNIVQLGGRTYGLVEAGGLPVELTYELESVARSNLGGTLPHGFSAHPKADPLTGEMHVLTYQPGLRALSYLVVGSDGLARTVTDIDAPHCPMVHNTAFTERFLIVLDLPVDFDPALVGKAFPFAWTNARMPRIGLIPRSGDLSRAQWIEAPSCYVFHVMNAFDGGDTAVVVDVVRHARVFDYGSVSGGGPSILVRWRLDLVTGTLSETILFDRACEFPRFNDARGGLDYRFGYTTAAQFGPIFKHDLRTGEVQTHDFGASRQALEPVFVARKGAVAEDDGYILAYVHDEGRGAADVVILDAQAFNDEPVATVHLPARVPFGFHGNWIADRD